MGSALLLHNLDFLLISLLSTLCLVSPFLSLSFFLFKRHIYTCNPDDAEDAGGDAVRALAAADFAGGQLSSCLPQLFKCTNVCLFFAARRR